MVVCNQILRLKLDANCQYKVIQNHLGTCDLSLEVKLLKRLPGCLLTFTLLKQILCTQSDNY